MLVFACVALACPARIVAQTSSPNADPATLSAPGPAVRLTYLANEGVLVEGRKGRVLIDALFADGLPDYAVVPPAMRDSLERAQGAFGGPMIVVTTHAHRDHYDSVAVERYREHNRAAIVVGPPGAGAGPGEPMDRGWVQVRPLAIPHGHTVRPVGHAAYLVTLDGVTALHLGDTSSDPATWIAAGVPAGGVDLALVPFWYALDRPRFEAMLGVLHAGTVVLLHTPRHEDGRWAGMRSELQDTYPQVRIPRAPGEFIEVRSNSAR